MPNGLKIQTGSCMYCMTQFGFLYEVIFLLNLPFSTNCGHIHIIKSKWFLDVQGVNDNVCKCYTCSTLLYTCKYFSKISSIYFQRNMLLSWYVLYTIITLSVEYRVKCKKSNLTIWSKNHCFCLVCNIIYYILGCKLSMFTSSHLIVNLWLNHLLDSHFAHQFKASTHITELFSTPNCCAGAQVRNFLWNSRTKYFSQ